MQFYKITHPDGRLEFGTVGTEATKRAKEIGGTSEAIEVETNKQGLLAFFNELAGSAPTPDTSSVTEPTAAPIQHSTGREVACEKCKFTPKAAQSYLAVIKKGLTMDAIREWIEEREGWELASTIETITHRLSDLAKAATGKNK